MSRTYRELLEYLMNVPDERLDDTVTVYVSGLDEFYGLVGDYPIVEAGSDKEKSAIIGQGDVLDPGHIYVVI